MDAAIGIAQSRRKKDLDDLIEELRIPSISSLHEHRADCLRCARWLAERFESLGFKVQVVDVTKDGLPVIVADCATASALVGFCMKRSAVMKPAMVRT